MNNELSTEKEIFKKVVEVVATGLGIEAEKITEEAKFVEDLGADSLDTVELVMALEDVFSIEIPDDKAENITTVKEAVKYLCNVKEIKCEDSKSTATGNTATGSAKSEKTHSFDDNK